MPENGDKGKTYKKYSHIIRYKRTRKIRYELN